MWERFSYYGMRAILVLYLVAQTETGGFGWSKVDALELYGWYTMLVYLTSIPGGIIADRWLGQKKSVMLGGALLVAGHSLMAFPGLFAFYGALALIVSGVGLLKPNISTMVGGLYAPGDNRRDSAFTIFYIGINLGAFIASLVVGYVGERIGWHYGFGLAGIGMLLGQIIFITGQKHLTHVGNLERTLSSSGAQIAHPAFDKADKDRIKALLISFLIVVVFWGAFEQAGGFMNLYTDAFVNRDIGSFNVPASWFQSLNPFFIIVFGGVMSGLWIWLAKRNKEPSSIAKMGLGTAVMGFGFVLMMGASFSRGAGWLQLETDSALKAGMGWVIGAYLLHTLGELMLSPVALSFITKTAPKRIVASMMGIFFAVTGIANFFAAKVGQQSEKLGELAVFTLIAVVSISLGLLMALFSGRINKLTHEKSVINSEFDKFGSVKRQSM